MIPFVVLALIAMVASFKITGDWITSFVLAFAITSGTYTHIYRGVLNIPASEDTD